MQTLDGNTQIGNSVRLLQVFPKSRVAAIQLSKLRFKSLLGEEKKKSKPRRLPFHRNKKKVKSENN